MSVMEIASRKVMVSPEIMEQWTRWRTPEGYLVTCEWGEPGRDGFYEPVFTVHEDDRGMDEIAPYTGPSLGTSATPPPVSA